MRRLVLLLAAVMLVTGCGEERLAAVRDTGTTSSAAPTMEPTPTPRPGPPSGELSGFPLDLGYADENGDDHSPVVVTGTPATAAFAQCGRQVWDPTVGGTDVIGVEFRGEAEWFRGRTLVLYPSTDVASEVVDRARDAIAECARDDGDEHGYAEHTLVDYCAGDQSVGWIDRWWSDDVGGFDTGLVVFLVARVGRAVLLSYEYGEGNGSDQTRRSAIARAAEADQPVVKAMGDL